MERQRELEQKEEEARQKQIEKENKEKNNRENRAKMREQKQHDDRIQREQKQLYDRVISDHDYLVTNRKRGRGDPIDYNNGEPEEASTNAPTRRKNPALREFQRYSSTDELDPHGGRNLRL